MGKPGGRLVVAKIPYVLVSLYTHLHLELVCSHLKVQSITLQGHPGDRIQHTQSTSESQQEVQRPQLQEC